MKVSVRRILDPHAEQVIIECVEVTREIEDIEAFVSSRGVILSGSVGDRRYSFNLLSVLYFEAVDEQVFAYTKDRVYEMRVRLYTLEEAYRDRFFIRCSKSMLINLMRLDSISPALNGRFIAHMKNGEKIMVSRQYVGALKKAVLGGASHGF